MTRDRAIRLIREAAELDQDDAGDVYPRLGGAAAIGRIAGIAAANDDSEVIAAIELLGADAAVEAYVAVRGKRKGGRRPRGGAAAERRLSIRVTEDEEAAWTELAGDRPLGEWIRERCNAARR